MKKMITTAGLAALGAATFGPTFAQDAMISQKPWAIGASLRGFYDDNYLTFPKVLRDRPGFDDNTFGFDLSPSAAINLRGDQTTFGLSYLYNFRYFIDRESPRDDHSHQIGLKLSHAFNERFKLDVKDSFVVAQEPSILDPTINIASPSRAEGDNIRNYGVIQLDIALVDKFSVALGYSNTYYDYEQDRADILRDFPATLGVGSRSAVLDRVEHLGFIDGNYQILPKTTLSLGYSYGISDYTSDDPLFGGLPGTIRDSNQHFITVGAKQHLNQQLDVSAKVGVQITDYDFVGFDDTTSPYVEGSARWAYMEGSSAQLGVRHQRLATDVRVDAAGVAPIADQEASTVYLSVNHGITAKITAVAMLQYQHSTYGESTPGVAEQTDDIFYGGITLAYQFNPHIAAEIGYTYDRLDSDFALRSFTRNRVFVGTRLSY